MQIGQEVQRTKGVLQGVVLVSGVVSWFSRKQKSVALSSTEAEYIAASMATCEAIWLRKLLVALFG